MKNLLFILMISLLAFSCGQKKGESSKAKFKIFSGNIIDPQATFPGGLLVMGRSVDGLQSFTIPYQAGLELDLKKGGWEFATIGWVGSSPIEGNQQCSYQRIEINSDIFTVNFNMNYQACLEASSLEGSRFSRSIFYNFIGGSYNGFKKLYVKTCSDLTTCSTQTQPTSFRVEIPTKLKGVISNIGAGAMSSNCVSGTYASNITPPHGGVDGFIGVQITTFSASACTGVPKTYYFNHGFGEVLNETFLENGTSVLRRGALSIHVSANNSSIALAPISFRGAYSNINAQPTLMGTNDLYIYNGANTMSVSPYVSSGNYLYYDGSSWTTFPETDSVKLLLQH